MIRLFCTDLGLNKEYNKIQIAPLVDDLYNNQQWIATVQAEVANNIVPPARIVLVGHHKDQDSWYLDAFPDYDYSEVPNEDVLNATTIRDVMFGSRMVPTDVMPKVVQEYITNWIKTNKKVFDNLCEEYVFTKEYKIKHKFVGAPYAPTFTTTDAVVINSGNILLVKRKHSPGKGLWALPGGFLGENDEIEDSMLRELEEETRIKMTRAQLRAAIKGNHVFGAPKRSLRGRTVTHAYLVVLNEKKNPKVRGSDDAERAKWFPISDFYTMSEELYEDHYSIASYMINRAG